MAYMDSKIASCLNYVFCVGLFISVFLPGIVSDEIDPVYKFLSLRLDDVLKETKNLQRNLSYIDHRMKHMEEKLQGLQTTPTPIDLRIEDERQKHDERMEQGKKLHENLQIQALAIKKMLSNEKALSRKSMENFAEAFSELKSEIQTQISVFNASFKEELKRIGTDFDHLKSEIRLEMMEYNKTLLKDISEINAMLEINLKDMYEKSNNNAMVVTNGIAKLTSDWKSTTHNISQSIQTMEENMVSNIKEIEKQLIADVKKEQNKTLKSISTLQEDVQSLSRNISTFTADLSNRISSDSTSLSSQISSHSNRIYRLEERINECSDNPCVNNATCVDGFKSYSCTCLTGYIGTNCEININECASVPCKNGGSCTDNVNGFTCTCQPGYGGVNCEKVVTSACTQDGDCSAVSNSVCSGTSSKTCTCKPGYKPSSDQLSCTLVLTNACTEDSDCRTVANSVCSGSSSKTCACKPGYKTSSDQLSCTAEPCSGWVKFANSCYIFLNDIPRTFLEAVGKCSQYNSHVLYIESADENNFLKQQLQNSSVQYWWNGMTDEREEGTWRWYGTNEVVTFFNWKVGEPNNLSTTEDCCHMGKSFSYKWNDTPCRPPLGYEAYAICEKTVTDLST